MSYRIHSAYSSNTLGAIAGYVASGSAFRTFQIQGNYFTGFSASVDFQSYKDFLVEFQNALRTVFPETSASFRYDWDSNRIILSSSIATTWQFQSGAQNVLGFNANYSTTTNVITGAKAPYYIWISSNPNRTDDSEIYEQEQIYTERIADSGRTYSVGQTRTCFYRDWIFNYEPKENVFVEKAETTNTFTYDVFLEELRKGPTPFVIFNDEDVSSPDYSQRDGLYEMRSEGYTFKPESVMSDYYDFWRIQFLTRLLSRPNQTEEENFSSTTLSGSLYHDELYWLSLPSAGITLTSNSTQNNLIVKTLVEQSPDKRLIDDRNFLPAENYTFRWKADVFADSDNWIDNWFYQPMEQTSSQNVPEIESESSLFNNRPVFSFGPDTNGNIMPGTYLQTPNTITQSFDSISIAFALNLKDNDFDGYILSTAPDSNLDNSLVLSHIVSGADSFFQFGYNAGGGSIVFQSSVADPVDTPVVYVITLDPSSHTGGKIYRNNVSVETIPKDTATDGTIDDYVWSMGSIIAGALNALSGSIPEIIVYNRELSATDLTNTFNYFNRYYELGLSESLPNNIQLALTTSAAYPELGNLPTPQLVFDHSITLPVSSSSPLKGDVEVNKKDGYTMAWCGVRTNSSSQTNALCSHVRFGIKNIGSILYENIGANSNELVGADVFSSTYPTVTSSFYQYAFDATETLTYIVTVDDTSKTINRYINGDLVTTETYPSLYTIENSLLAGVSVTSSVPATTLFAASYNKVLSSAELNSILLFASQSYNIGYTEIV